VCEPAEDLSSADPVLGEVDLRRPGARPAWPCCGALAVCGPLGSIGPSAAVAASAAAGRRFSDVLARAGDGKVTMGALDVAGLSWTSWDMIHNVRRADQANSGITDVRRTEHGCHMGRNGVSAGQRLF
jgi:hypothetical protein